VRLLALHVMTSGATLLLLALLAVPAAAAQLSAIIHDGAR